MNIPQDHLNQLAAIRKANKENKDCPQQFLARFDSRQPEIDALVQALDNLERLSGLAMMEDDPARKQARTILAISRLNRKDKPGSRIYD